MKHFFIIVLCFWLLSCGGGGKTVFSLRYEFENDHWKRLNILMIETLIEKPVTCDVFMEFELDTNFKYNELPLNFTFYIPGGSQRSADRSFLLKDDRGKWKGKIKQDAVYIPIEPFKNLSIADTGLLRIRIEQKIPYYQTQGFRSLEFQLIKSISGA